MFFDNLDHYFVSSPKLETLLQYYYPDARQRKQVLDLLLGGNGFYVHTLEPGRTWLIRTEIPGEFVFESLVLPPMQLPGAIISKLAWLFMKGDGTAHLEVRFPIIKFIEVINDALQSTWSPSVLAQQLMTSDETVKLQVSNGIVVGAGVNPIFYENPTTSALDTLYSLTIEDEWLVARWKYLIPLVTGQEIPSVSLFVASDLITGKLNGYLSNIATLYIQRLEAFIVPFVNINGITFYQPAPLP